MPVIAIGRQRNLHNSWLGDKWLNELMMINYLKSNIIPKPNSRAFNITLLPPANLFQVTISTVNKGHARVPQTQSYLIATWRLLGWQVIESLNTWHCVLLCEYLYLIISTNIGTSPPEPRLKYSVLYTQLLLPDIGRFYRRLLCFWLHWTKKNSDWAGSNGTALQDCFNYCEMEPPTHWKGMRLTVMSYYE